MRLFMRGDEALEQAAPPGIGLGGGRRLFDSLGPCHLELELVRRLEGPGVMHLRYRVRGTR